MDSKTNVLFDEKITSNIISELKAPVIENFIISVLNQSETNRVISYELGQKVLISAAIMDAVNNHVAYEVLNPIMAELEGLKLIVSKHRMSNALEKILSYDSELQRIWSNNKEYLLWQESIKIIIKSIRGY